MLTGVVVFIFPNDAAQIAISMLAAFLSLRLFEVLSPYKSEYDMWLSRGGHMIVFLSMFHLLLLKVDVSDERDESQAVFAGVLVAGHVMMALAIVVEVADWHLLRVPEEPSRRTRSGVAGEVASGRIG